MAHGIDAGSLRSLIESYLDKFNKPGSCVDLGDASSITVVGDLHGSLYNLEEAVRIWSESGSDKIVFLGDYVDRGPSGLEVLTRLLELKLAEPGKVILLRGNHESPSMNARYGFREELNAKLSPGKAREIMELIVELYTTLDWIALRDDMLLVHGGIPCKKCSEGKPASLDDICSAVKSSGQVKDTVYNINPILMQLVWNDPRGDIEWFYPSIRGEGVYYYGLKAWLFFMKKHRIKLIVRSHEAVDAFSTWTRDGGFIEGEAAASLLGSSTINDLEGYVVTVFTSSYHYGLAGLLVYRDDGFKPFLIG